MKTAETEILRFILGISLEYTPINKINKIIHETCGTQDENE